jgi:hypothetical protein
MVSTRGFGVKNRNFRGFSLGKEVPKTFFGLRWPSLLHNLGLAGGLEAPEGESRKIREEFRKFRASKAHRNSLDLKGIPKIAGACA